MSTMSVRRLPCRTQLAATALAVAAAATSAVTGTGDAEAVTREYPLHNCVNISPNIVDLPYMPTRVFVSDYAGKTYLQITYGSLWLLTGYDSVARLDWHNLRTDQRGTLIDHSSVRPPNTGVHNFTIASSAFGPGKVRLTLSTVNRNALWAIPARSCSGTVVAP